jgi:hypothetical protein
MNDFFHCAYTSWAPKIGDATPMGWVVTLGYFYTAMLIVYMLRKLRRISPERRRIYVQFWVVVLFVYVLLGLNKQLDLQTFITATGRCMARTEGWYAERRSFQLTAILYGLAFGLSSLFVFFYYFRSITSRCLLAFVGLSLSGLFVFLRAISFHHIDSIFSATVANLKLHALLELTAIMLVAVNAIRLAHSRSGRISRDAAVATRIIT